MILRRNRTKHEYADLAFCTVNTILSLGQDIRAQTQYFEKIRPNLSLRCNTTDQLNVSVNVKINHRYKYCLNPIPIGQLWMSNQKGSIFRNTIYRLGIFIFVVAILSISLLVGIGSNQSQVTIAQLQQQPIQQQMQANQTFTPSVEEQRQLMEGLSFQIDNVTFSHRMASVNNGTQIHYVIGGQGPPVVLLHGWPETWYAWHKVMPDLAQNYTVIAPDLRGLGDSSKPPTGYDGKTVAEDIHQLVTQLGFRTIFLVGHDIGTQVAYSYAAEHPTEVEKLVVMDLTIPGFAPPGITPRWWFLFHQTPDIPEALVEGKEMEYLLWHLRGLALNPSAITQEAINEYVSHYSAPGGMRAGFEYYRAFPEDAMQNQNYSQTKLPMPVLALGAAYIPVLGGNITTPTIVYGMQQLAENVQGIKVPNSGHFIAEEQPEFVISQLSNFFGRDTTTNNSIR